MEINDINDIIKMLSKAKRTHMVFILVFAILYWFLDAETAFYVMVGGELSLIWILFAIIEARKNDNS